MKNDYFAEWGFWRNLSTYSRLAVNDQNLTVKIGHELLIETMNTTICQNQGVNVWQSH